MSARDGKITGSLKLGRLARPALWEQLAGVRMQLQDTPLLDVHVNCGLAIGELIPLFRLMLLGRADQAEEDPRALPAVP